MKDHRAGPAAVPATAAAPDSHAATPKPRRKRPVPTEREQAQKDLDAGAPVALHQRLVVDYAEAAALGISPERTLRRLVATGRVKRSVIRAGRRVRFVVRDLLDELREGGE